MPGMKGVFDIMIFENIGQTDHYALDLDYKVTQPKSQVIEITSSELTRGPLDNITIRGTVVNNGDATANMVKVTATLYDRHGNVIAVSQDRTEPDYLRASGESFFIVTIQDKLQANKAVDYSVVAESEEYTMVPEFPFGRHCQRLHNLPPLFCSQRNILSGQKSSSGRLGMSTEPFPCG
jgi:hypothetical protein